MTTTLKKLITSFTKAIDVYNYLLKDHHRRTAVGAYHIGQSMGLSEESLCDLIIAAALHDIGALTIAERDQLIQMDVENPYPHSALGCYMLNSFEPFYKISRIVYYHHWSYSEDQLFHPNMGAVPIEAYILHVADRTDILINQNQSPLMQKQEIINQIKSYRGTLFHPKVVDAFEAMASKDSFWLDIDNLEMEKILSVSIGERYEIELTMDLLEQFAYTLSKIIDTRSKYAISHSFGVSEVAYKISEYMGYPEEKRRKIRVAGLLHDMGKIAVPTEIIEKAGSLTETERMDVRTHAYFTFLILSQVEDMSEIVEWASGHHENHDGSGYPMNLVKSSISEEMDIIAYADIFTALSEDRPYRRGMHLYEILQILENEFIEKHGETIYQQIVTHQLKIDQVCKHSVAEGNKRFQAYEVMAGKVSS